MDHIVSWCRNGTAFMVHRPDDLLQLLSLFFGQTKYRSFTRQLSTWFFEREEHGPFKGAYHHPYFIKDDKGLCAKMSRNNPPDRELYIRAVDQLAFGNTDHQTFQKEYTASSSDCPRMLPPSRDPSRSRRRPVDFPTFLTPDLLKIPLRSHQMLGSEPQADLKYGVQLPSFIDEDFARSVKIWNRTQSIHKAAGRQASRPSTTQNHICRSDRYWINSDGQDKVVSRLHHNHCWSPMNGY